MPPAKAAKKTAKKAAKKNLGHDPNKAGKDARRAYEHLGRVQALLSLQDSATADRVQQLIPQAQGALKAGQPKEAADLLRAAEHLSFGSLRLADSPDETISRELAAVLQDEIAHQQGRAEEHGEAKSSAAVIRAIYRFMADSATEALATKRYRAALEFARGAEALTHLNHLSALALSPGPAAKRLSK